MDCGLLHSSQGLHGTSKHNNKGLKNSVTITQVTAARQDADVVNGNAGKHTSKLGNENHL